MKFVFYWNDGTKEIIEDNTAEDALDKTKYSADFEDHLVFYTDYYNEGIYWDENLKKWVKKYTGVISTTWAGMGISSFKPKEIEIIATSYSEAEKKLKNYVNKYCDTEFSEINYYLRN